MTFLRQRFLRTMLGAQEVPASGADVVQGGIEFLITPSTATSRKVLPAGPAQVTIRGVGQSYPISVDCRSTAASPDFLLFAGRTVRARCVYDPITDIRAYVRACVRLEPLAIKTEGGGVRLAVF